MEQHLANIEQFALADHQVCAVIVYQECEACQLPMNEKGMNRNQSLDKAYMKEVRLRERNMV